MSSKEKTISRFQFITHPYSDISLVRQAELACNAGCDWIQLRAKNTEVNELTGIASEIQKICRSYQAKLIINDHVELAMEIKADGVHLGKDDIPPAKARKMLGNEFIIGGTANTFERIAELTEAGVDYLGVGPLRYTATKEVLSPVLGYEGFRKIMEQCEMNGISIPVIAIGGIDINDLSPLREAGVYGVALSSAVLKGGIEDVVPLFVER
ncbi:MAG: thiamine phosphate synthase [Bacteroidetes bacterium]|nr:thiamine phosphate synthase [Bacteroidota bacterium]